MMPRPPQIVLVTGLSGGGKSSVMAQLRDVLSRPQASGREWIPIGFDAWKYERSERIWAAARSKVPFSNRPGPQEKELT